MCHKSATTSFLNPYFAKKFSKPSNVFLRLVSPPEPMRRTPSKLNPFGTSLCFHLRTASSYPKFGACSNDFYCTKVAFIYNEGKNIYHSEVALVRIHSVKPQRWFLEKAKWAHEMTLKKEQNYLKNECYGKSSSCIHRYWVNYLDPEPKTRANTCQPNPCHGIEAAST